MTKKKHGGRRLGAGRKFKYGKPLVTKGVPESSESELDDALLKLLLETQKRPSRSDHRMPNIRHSVEIPLYSDRIQAGAPSHADDDIEEYIDINDFVGAHANIDYFLKVSGESMRDAGIFPDDILSVEKSKHPKNGDIVVVFVDGGLTVKRLLIDGGIRILRSENDSLPNFSETTYSDGLIRGIVRGVVRKL